MRLHDLVCVGVADASGVVLNLRLILNNVEELGLGQYLVGVIGFYPPFRTVGSR